MAHNNANQSSSGFGPIDFSNQDQSHIAQSSAINAGNTAGIFPELDVLNPSNQTGGGTFGDLDFRGKIGAIGTGFQAFSSLANIYAGFKAIKLQKDQFKFQKEAFNKNFAAQAKSFENELRDRFAARSASAQVNNRDFQSLSTFLDQRAIPGT